MADYLRALRPVCGVESGQQMHQDTKESILAVVGAIVFTTGYWMYRNQVAREKSHALEDPVGITYDTFTRDMQAGKPDSEIFGYHPERFKKHYADWVWYPIT